MKYHIVTFGCQMNISDSERISAVLDKLKYKKTWNINEADLIVVNMCSVRQSAVDRVHGLIPKFKKLRTNNKKLKTILTGCILKKDKKIFADNFDFVLDIKEINQLTYIARQQILQDPHRLASMAAAKRRGEPRTEQARAGGRSVSGKISLPSDCDYLKIVPKYSSKFSANVPIMTGCNNFCAYCVVPHTRDREISRPAKEIISEIKNLVKKNYKEIWLLGQNVNSYKDNSVSSVKPTPYLSDRSNKELKIAEPEINFPKLLKMVNDIPGNFWIRFTSSHPKDFNNEVIKAMAIGGKITPYLNLPIQSGDDKILKSMNRHYTVAQYKNIIKKLRKNPPAGGPDICLSTDIIIGFPGETKKQFENTAKLFRDIKYDMAYINKYSTRAGTAASKLKDDVSITEKKRREKVLTEILKQTALENNKKLLGKITTVLIEEKKDDYWIGKNEQYKTIKIYGTRNIKHETNLIGKFVRVKIIKAHEWALEGNIINEK